MSTARVKWFDDEKGYGFLESDDHEDDIFVHYSEIDTNGFASLKEGQTVECGVERGPKGLSALDVKPQ